MSFPSQVISKLGFTITSHVSVLPLAVAVIVAVPVPVGVTVAVLEFEESGVTLAMPVVGSMPHTTV